MDNNHRKVLRQFDVGETKYARNVCDGTGLGLSHVVQILTNLVQLKFLRKKGDRYTRTRKPVK